VGLGCRLGDGSSLSDGSSLGDGSSVLDGRDGSDGEREAEPMASEARDLIASRLSSVQDVRTNTHRTVAASVPLLTVPRLVTRPSPLPP
jgi:hypothetical protein